MSTSMLYTEKPIRLPSTDLPTDYMIDVCVMVDNQEITLVSQHRRWKARAIAAENISIVNCGNSLYLRWKYKHVVYEIQLAEQVTLPKTFLPGPLLEALGFITSLKSVAATLASKVEETKVNQYQ